MYLGAVIFVPFMIVLAVRKPLERRFVLSAPGVEQPRRQFYFDFTLGFVAGLAAAIYNHLIVMTPTSSGVKLVVGVLMAMFFFSLDMALARERVYIYRALEQNVTPQPLKKVKPLTRTFALVATVAALCILIVLGLVLAKDMSWLSQAGNAPGGIMAAALAVTYEIAFVLLVLLLLLINLIISYTRTLNLIFKSETDVLKKVSEGDFSRRVPVASANEFGLIAEFTNNMISGLEHRIELLGALEVAEEVQASLLPKKAPNTPGVEMAAVSRYSDETGGDYYDFLRMPDGHLAVAVGDVAGHGVGSALLMASARAMLRMAISQTSELEKVVGRVNRHLSRDVHETGNFLTLFLMEIDPDAKRLFWVSGGHDPALLFDPGADEFVELSGRGMALGLSEETIYRQYQKDGWAPNSVLVVGTDGIWETHNPRREMFGKKRFREIIRANASRSPETIVSEVLNELNAFRDGAEQEDDVTLVVAKLS